MKKYIALTVLPLGVLIALISYYAVDLPVWDEWEMIKLLDKFYAGTLSFRDIFAQHNEHRIILGKIIMLGNAILTHWNIYIELAVNVLFAAGTSVVIFLMTERINGLTEIKKMIIYFTSACLIFSFSQSQNWLWGFQMQILMCVFFAVISAYMIQMHIMTAVIFAVLASFSFANGMVIWPAGLIAMFIHAYSSGQKNFGKMCFWLISGIITVALYFYDFRYSAMQASFQEKIFFMITHPHVFMILFASYLGAPLAGHRQAIALGAGIAGLAIQIYSLIILIRHERRNNNWNDNYLFWICTDLFVLFSAGVTSLGRSVTVSSTMALRYISISMLFWICTISISAYALELVKHNIHISLYVLFAFIILVLSVDENHMIAARERNEALNTFKSQMQRGEYDNRLFRQSIYPFRSGVRRINLCREYGIRHFENAPFIEEFNDFTEIQFDSDALTHDNNALHIEKFDLHSDNFFSLIVWHKFKTEDCSVILYNGKDKAFMAQMQKFQHKRRLVLAKRNDPYDFYTRNYVTADWAYYGNLPEGTYSVAVKIADKYFPVEGITITR